MKPDALILGIESSCDETAAAVLRADGTILAEAVFSQQQEHAAFGGVVPEIAARAHLQRLRGRRHELVTALVCHRAGQRIWQHVAKPSLTMRHFSDAFLEAYLAAEGEALLSSVGAYRLEGHGAQLFDRIEGDQPAILGMPLLPLLGFLRQHGVLLR